MGPVIIGLLTELIVVACIICLVIAKIQSKHLFQCKHCGKEFHPKWTQLVFEIHVLKQHKIRCPFCKEKDFCEDKGKPKKQIEGFPK